MVSMKDVAIASGVSVSTVSKALRDYSDISPETKDRICRTASELGYREQENGGRFCSREHTEENHNLGILIDDSGIPSRVHRRFLQGIPGAVKEAAVRGYDTAVINYDLGENRDLSLSAAARRRKVDGMIIVCSHGASSSEYYRISDSGLPAVSVGMNMKGIPSVVFDRTEGAERLLEAIFENTAVNIAKIAYIGGNSNFEDASVRNRIKKTAAHYGAAWVVPKSDAAVRENDWEDDSTEGQICRLLGLRKRKIREDIFTIMKKEKVDCIIVSEDEDVPAVKEALRDMGMNPWSDVVIASLSSFIWTGSERGRIHACYSMEYDISDLFEKTIQYLVNEIERPWEEKEIKQKVKGRVVRKNTAGIDTVNNAEKFFGKKSISC